MSLITNLNKLSDNGYEIITRNINEEILFTVKNKAELLVAIGLQVDENFNEEEAWFPKYNERFALLFSDYLDYCTSLSNTETVLFIINSKNIWFMPINQTNPIGVIQNSIEPLINIIEDNDRRASENI